MSTIDTTRPMISVVVPLYDEVGSVQELHGRLLAALHGLKRSFEIIFVDDGSGDGTFAVAKDLTPLILIRLKRNYGQSVALSTGIHAVRGEVIVTLDGDLENPPEEIPRLVEKIDQGYGIVSGWRQARWRDRPFSRRFPSLLANAFVSWVTGVNLHDHGCQLKAYRRECLSDLTFSGDMHRMAAAYAARSGARIIEIPVRFEKRKYGRSKYGIFRVFKVLLDVLVFHFFQRFATRPMHFFGVIGFAMLFFGGLIFLLMLAFRFFLHMPFISTPLPMLSAFFIIIAFQFILMGLLAEMIYRFAVGREQSGAEVAEIVRNS